MNNVGKNEVNLMSSTQLNISGDNQCSHSEKGSLYYGVHIPSDIPVQDNDGFINVFKDQTEALKVVKKYKRARFKSFNYYHEAAEFAVHGFENPNNNTTVDGSSFNHKINSDNTQPVGEKPSPFRGPKSQDLVKLRKGIEAGDLNLVQTTIWDNPRYLISSGDTPSILQEGPRYNALHIAARYSNHEMCELILSTISNIAFIKLLYGEENHQNPYERADMLLDLYLNTPDKSFNETPLHFACKFGALKVVEVLVSYPQCDRTLRNKFSETPRMIICDRKNKHVVDLARKIEMLLEENYYVPVLRSEDNCMPPVIGEPFSPKSPLSLTSDVASPRMEIHAYAGPMNKEGAENFRKLWKTPPRSSTQKSPMNNMVKMKLRDPEKGLERLGSIIAQEMGINWKEYWPFLDSFIDLSTTEGLEQLDNYFKSRFNKIYSINLTKTNITTSKNVSPSSSPLSDLCRVFQACNLNDSNAGNSKFNQRPNHDIISEVHLLKSDLSPLLCIEKSCQVFAHRIAHDILHSLETEYSSTTTTVLEGQIKQLQLLMASFMEDERFSKVDFQLIHSRLGLLITYKLKEFLKLEDEHNLMCKTISTWLENCSKSYDCFSSDDEAINCHQNTNTQKKCTSKNKQVICLLQCILCTLFIDIVATDVNVNTECECLKAWEQAKQCSCVWRSKLTRKKNSFKHISRRLFSSNNDDASHLKSASKSSESSSDEEYYTPPSTPTMLQTDTNYSSDDEYFSDCEIPEIEIFIEGNIPTKMDCDVYNALKYAHCEISCNNYVYLYKWYHTVGLHSESERLSWTNTERIVMGSFQSPNCGKSILNKTEYQSCHSFPRSWLRVTGPNSPQATLKAFKGNFSFNL